MLLIRGQTEGCRARRGGGEAEDHGD
jgi:hypothetical protein